VDFINAIVSYVTVRVGTPHRWTDPVIEAIREVLIRPESPKLEC
jgi:hypothetical protein